MQSQEIENAKLANTLHEDINQLLSVAKMHLDQSNENQDMHQQKSANNIQLALQGIRKLAHSLTIPFGDDYEFEDAIEDLLLEYPEHRYVKVNFSNQLENEQAIKPGIKISVYRIIQEAFKNIFEFANAQQLFVQITDKAEGLQLIIEDDGVGFEYDFDNMGIGIKKIYNRVVAHAGTLDVQTSIGKGCRLDIYFPMQNSL
jgi:signal transduction histidine kinase